MECIQLRSPPGPFHYLISEQAKSLVALQELQNEVGALLEFRDLVIETFPNLRSKMAPSTPASDTRRDWEPGVRVRRKLAGGGGGGNGNGEPRTKPQPSVQDSGFSTETSCGKDTARSRPLEDELWALLDVIQRKGARLRDDAELARADIEHRHSEESFAAALADVDVTQLRVERDALLTRAAALEAAAAVPRLTLAPTPTSAVPSTPLGRLDDALDTPSRPPRVPTPDSKKFAAILLESNPVELQRQLLTSTVQNQLLCERLKRAAAHRTQILERLERARDLNEDLKFRLEEKTIELEGARARVRQLEGKSRSPDSLERSRDAHGSMRDMEPLHIPDGDADSRSESTRRGRPSRIPLHTGSAHKPSARSPAPLAPVAPLAPAAAPLAPPRPPSVRSARSASSLRRDAPKSSVPVRRPPPADSKRSGELSSEGEGEGEGEASALVVEYVSRATRLAPLVPRVRPLPPDLPPYPPDVTAPNLALELTASILYHVHSLDRPHDQLWNNKPQQYFESMNYADRSDDEYDADSLAP